MAKIAASDLRDAAKRVSSTPPSGSRGVSGFRDPEVPWRELQGKMARALVATPDLVFYFSYLCTNQASAKLTSALDALNTLILLVEGVWKEQKEVSSPTAASKYVSLSTASGYLDVAKVSAIEAKVDKYISEELVPSIKSGSRAQKKGPEARSAYAKAKKELWRKWTAAHKLVSTCARGHKFTADLLLQAAAKTPVLNLAQTLALPPPEDNLTAYTLQLAAAMSAMKAMAREVRLEYRVRIGEDETFPEGVALSETYQDGVLYQLSFGKHPKELGIRSGDLVSWGTGTAIVQLVGDETITLKDSDIAERSTGTFKIEPAARPAWKATAEALKEGRTPTIEGLKRQVARREGRAAAEIRDLIVYLAGVHAHLDALSSDVEALLERVGGEVTAPDTTILATLTGYSPFFSSKTTKVGDAILRELEKEGFDYAKDLLLQGDIDAFFTITALGASKRSRLLEHARVLAGMG